ncbi:3'-5' exonuclease [Pseudonocardia broussonetiae]|uniref:AAA family ATPase n=1 Tax=Pseudonocardia broussonetiae TaxID=2736640 RepID=A0A6M6JTF8_9PSEU|nr:3'-5' exonuclease [Pseudonocardia broussonetiae]QJY49852.1 AAA family ATPase [Pseudonocardia broussonetiae]
MTSSVQDLHRRASAGLGDRPGTVLLAADGPDRPDLLLIDRAVGLLAIEFDPHGHSATDRAPFVRLNRKRAELRAALGGLADAGVGGAVVLGAATGPFPVQPASAVLGLPELDDAAWPDRLPPRPLDEETFRAIVDRLAPSIVFTRRGRTSSHDPGSVARADLRLQLDAAQAAVALAAVRDVAVVTGPPGSGKTLLLAARARQLATAHPGWTVAVVMYNKSLMHYVNDLIGVPSVLVGTVGRIAHHLGLWVDFAGGPAAAAALTAVRARRLPPVLDALLVDEAQDLDPAWLHTLMDAVRPGRGGTVIVADPAQGLYRDVDLDGALRGRDVARHVLIRPYRSTRPILRAAQALAPAGPGIPSAGAPDGEPVDLVWAASWDEQAACVAAEVQAMIADGHRRPADIAVLVTKIGGTLKRLRLALDERQVAYAVVDRDNSATYTPGADAVTLLTVHSGKGHEFPVVVLFGLEAVPDGRGDAEAARKARVGYVGVTRARDQLLITYTRTNPHVANLLDLGDDVRRWTWPDDYEV